MRNQRNEFEFIISSLPQGIMLARINNGDGEQSLKSGASVKAIRKSDVSGSSALPFQTQFVNEELKKVFELGEGAGDALKDDD